MKRPASQAPQQYVGSAASKDKTAAEGRELADLVRKGLISREVVLARRDRVAVAAQKDLRDRP